MSVKKTDVKHIKEEHPGAKWPCEFCGKQYDSYNGKYKHERSAHSKKKYLCSNVAVDSIINHSWICILQLMTPVPKFTVRTVAKALPHALP